MDNFEAFASVMTETAWCSGTLSVPPDQLKLYYASPIENDACSARWIDFASATDNDLTELVKACEPAPFGRAQANVLDDSYRKALKLDTTRFSTSFDLHSTPILETMKNEMMIQSELRAELYKLNIYETGGFFKTHKDTPRSEDMIASLVVVLPVTHQGGSLRLRHDSQQFTFDSAKELHTPHSCNVSYVAFFSDTDHEVQEITSGQRVTLTYNIYLNESNGNTLKNAQQALHTEKDAQICQALRRVIEDESRTQRRLIFGFQHQYVFSSGMKVSSAIFRMLKGIDASLLRACETLDLHVYPRVLYRINDSEPDEYEYALCQRFANPDVDGSHEFEGEYALFVDRLQGEVIGHYHILDEDAKACHRGKECTSWEERKLKIITAPNVQNRVRSEYMAYGNEAYMSHVYGDVVLVVEMPTGNQESD